MRAFTPVPALLMALLIALAGCSDTPVSPQTAPSDTPLALEVRAVQSCRPDAPPAAPPLFIVTAPQQRVIVQLGDGTLVEGRFRSQFLGRTDGQACGQGRMELEAAGPDVPNLSLSLEYTRANLLVQDGQWIRILFEGDAEVCLDHGQTCTVSGFAGGLLRSRGEEDPVWILDVPALPGSAAGVRVVPSQTKVIILAPTGPGGTSG
jgi:hypothetical protein